jgi:hypothetical protein
LLQSCDCVHGLHFVGSPSTDELQVFVSMTEVVPPSARGN